MAVSKKQVWLYLCLAILAIGFGLVLIYATRPPPALSPVTVFPASYKIPAQKASVLGRWIPRNWSWFWRLKPRFGGRSKQITLTTSMLEFSSPPKEVLSSFGLSEGMSTNAGLHVWITNETTLNKILQRLENDSVKGGHVIASPRVTTSDGTRYQMGMSRSIAVAGVPINAGVVVEGLPRVHKDSTDLTCVLRASEVITNNIGPEALSPSNQVISVQTNFEIAARFQIPPGDGVFLLKEGDSSKGKKTTGVIISIGPVAKNATSSSRLTRVIVRTNAPPAGAR